MADGYSYYSRGFLLLTEVMSMFLPSIGDLPEHFVCWFAGQSFNIGVPLPGELAICNIIYCSHETDDYVCSCNRGSYSVPQGDIFSYSEPFAIRCALLWSDYGEYATFLQCASINSVTHIDDSADRRCWGQYARDYFTKTLTQTPRRSLTITTTTTVTTPNNAVSFAFVIPYEYAYLANVMYEKQVDMSRLNVNFPGWSEVRCSAYAVLSSGFYGQLFNKGGTYVFVIRGTDLALTGNIAADIDLALNNDLTGYLNNYVTQAIDYLSTAFSYASPTCLTFTGHSLGLRWRRC